jgi:hypothetical protein
MLFSGSRSRLRNEAPSSLPEQGVFPSEVPFLLSDFDGEGYKAGDQEALMRIANQAVERRMAAAALRDYDLQESPGEHDASRALDEFVDKR